MCKKMYVGHGHNADPIKKGYCCNSCNVLVQQKRLKDS